MTIFIFLITAILFSVVSVIIAVTLKKLFSRQQNVLSLLKISVVAAAKNEELNAAEFIKSLSNQQYPAENYEVIIVDDNSSDLTYKRIKELISSLHNFSVVTADVKKYPGKKGALDLGISLSKNEFIMITDADCRPANNWLSSFAAKFNEGFDFLLGTAPFFNNGSFVNKISCYENLRSSILTFTAAARNFPYSAAARNFGFKRSSFEKISGYKNTVETLSGDDDLLLREAVKHKLKIGIVAGKKSFVYSSAKESFNEYLLQKARHTKTSLHYLLSRQIFLSVWHILNLIMLFSPLLMFINPYFIFLFLFKIIIDLAVVRGLQNNFGYSFKMYEIIFLQILYEIFTVINFINSIFRKDVWK